VDTKKTLRKLFYPLTLVGLAIVFSAHRLTRLTSSPGLLNTDVEGTMWWLWSRCTFQSSLSRSEYIGFPSGFSFEALPFWNLWDELRIQLLRWADCDQAALVLVFSLAPTIFMMFNALCAYLLGLVILANRHFSFLLALIVAFSSQIVLGTRTPLSNIIYFWGLLSLFFLIRFFRSKNVLFLFLSLVLLTLQTLFNVYTGALFVYLGLTFVFSFSGFYTFRLREKVIYSFSIIFSAIVGLTPLISSQMYLFLNNEKTEAIRPVEIGDSTLPIAYLFFQDRGLYSLIIPEQWIRPSAGWLSTPLLIGVCWGIFKHIQLRKSKHPYVIASRWMIASSLLLTFIIYEIPGSFIVHKLYFSIFSPLRGVSNFSVAIGIQLLFSVLLLVQFFQMTKNTKFIERWRVAVAFVFLVGVFLYENVPLDKSFWSRDDVTPFIDAYKDPSLSPHIGPVLHFPDWSYGTEWGTPQRFIQLAQIGDQQARINGRDYESFTAACAPTPLPINDENFEVLLDRGVRRIIVHHNLIDPITLSLVLEFLGQKAVTEVRSIHPLSSRTLYQSLDITVFTLDNARQPKNRCLSGIQTR